MARTHDFVAAHLSMDERLEEAFVRYDAAFKGHSEDLLRARMDLSLILWTDEDPPEQVGAQLCQDADELLRDTPPL